MTSNNKNLLLKLLNFFNPSLYRPIKNFQATLGKYTFPRFLTFLNCSDIDLFFIFKTFSLPHLSSNGRSLLFIYIIWIIFSVSGNKRTHRAKNIFIFLQKKIVQVLVFTVVNKYYFCRQFCLLLQVDVTLSDLNIGFSCYSILLDFIFYFMKFLKYFKSKLRFFFGTT